MGRVILARIILHMYNSDSKTLSLDGLILAAQAELQRIRERSGQLRQAIKNLGRADGRSVRRLKRNAATINAELEHHPQPAKNRKRKACNCRGSGPAFAILLLPFR